MMRKLYRWNLLATVAFSAALLVVVSAAGQDAAEDRGGNPPAETMTTESAGQTAQPSALPADQVGPAATDATAGEPADQTADGQPVPSPTKPTRPPWMMLALIVGMVLLFVFMGRKPKQQEKKRKEMLATIKKGDKVTTIGGMVGAVMEVRENEVTVKIDESSNTRAKFALWAIRSVGSTDAEQENK